MTNHNEGKRVRKHGVTLNRTGLIKLRPVDDLTLALAERRSYELSHVKLQGISPILVRTCAEHGWGGWDVVRQTARNAVKWSGTYPFNGTGVAYRAHPINTADAVRCVLCQSLNGAIIDHTVVADGPATIPTASIRAFKMDTEAADPWTVFPYPDEPSFYLGCGDGRNPTVSMWGELPPDSSVDEFATTLGQVEVPWHHLPASTRAHIRFRIKGDAL